MATTLTLSKSLRDELLSLSDELKLKAISFLSSHIRTASTFNPSPSGDTYWDDIRNVHDMEESIDQAKQGKLKTYSIDDIKSTLGI